MNSGSSALETCEIRPRFRQSLKERILRLEPDADEDERVLGNLEKEDPMRRHRRLVAVQRAEALRTRLFLDRAWQRLPWPTIALCA
jgi:hypothetical protein